jgi:glycerophosphoryl diester phosphodiesterase
VMVELSNWAIALIVIGGYWLLSEVLLHSPRLLCCRCCRPRPVPSFRIHHASHRGGGGERPENTLSSFAHAVSVGSHLLELDLAKTADGCVVVFHDHTLARVAGVDKTIADFNYDDLPRLRPERLTCQWTPSAAAASAESKSSADASASASQPTAAEEEAYRIPTFESILQRFPDTVLNIDCKSGRRSRRTDRCDAGEVRPHTHCPVGVRLQFRS